MGSCVGKGGWGSEGERRGEIISIFERQVGGDGRECNIFVRHGDFGALKRKDQSWSSGKRKDNLGRDMSGWKQREAGVYREEPQKVIFVRQFWSKPQGIYWVYLMHKYSCFLLIFILAFKFKAKYGKIYKIYVVLNPPLKDQSFIIPKSGYLIDMKTTDRSVIIFK